MKLYHVLVVITIAYLSNYHVDFGIFYKCSNLKQNRKINIQKYNQNLNNLKKSRKLEFSQVPAPAPVPPSPLPAPAPLQQPAPQPAPIPVQQPVQQPAPAPVPLQQPPAQQVPAAAQPPIPPINPNPGCVIVYEYPNHGGRGAHLCTNVANLELWRWNRKLSSVKIGSGAFALLYDQINFQGNNIQITRSWPNFSGFKWDNRASSIVVGPITFNPTKDTKPLPGCFIIYDAINYQGKGAYICGDFGELTPYNWDNKVSSIKVGPGTVGFIYDYKFFKGRVLRIQTDTPNLRTFGWDERTSSIKVQRLPK